MKKYTVYIGLNDQDSKVQIITTENALTLAENIFCEYCGGATLTTGRGVYTHDDGQKVIENTIIAAVFGCELESVKRAALECKRALNQESVALECYEVESNFI